MLKLFLFLLIVFLLRNFLKNFLKSAVLFNRALYSKANTKKVLGLPRPYVRADIDPFLKKRRLCVHGKFK